MANNNTQLYLQFVLAVKYRGALISPSWKDGLHQCVTGIFHANYHKLLLINSMPDHIHMFVCLNPTQSLETIIQKVKSESTQWINEQQLTAIPFAWQNDYGAFSYAKSDIPSVTRYIQHQEQLHKQQTFLQEFEALLKEFHVEYDELFKEPV